jgi:hypothetical protein
MKEITSHRLILVLILLVAFVTIINTVMLAKMKSYMAGDDNDTVMMKSDAMGSTKLMKK